MKVSYLHGVCVRNDAISNAIADEITWLSERAGNDVRLFAYACDHPKIRCTVVDQLGGVALHPHFQDSDLVVFHFGVYYPLFNLLPVVPRKAKRLVVFHNITPKAFLPEAAHSLIDRSFAQMSNIQFAHHVICVSETNLTVLRDAGISVPATVLPLAVHCAATAPLQKPSFEDGVGRIAFVGRFVKSKGPLDLLDAVASLLLADSSRRLRLDLVGNLKFSDQAVVAEVVAGMRALGAQFGARFSADLHGDAPDTLKARILAEADLFVLPTLHEGFCVPILEAIANGCRVVCYDNSNTPAVSGGLAQLIPTGNIALLVDGLEKSLCDIHATAWKSGGGYADYRQRAAVHLEQFRPDRVKDRFLRFLASFAN